MSTTILKFEVTAFRPKNDDSPDTLAASISVPIEEDDEVIGEALGDEKLIAFTMGSLHDLAVFLRPEWLDNEDISVTFEAYLGGSKCQTRGGIIAMKPDSYTFDLND